MLPLAHSPEPLLIIRAVEANQQHLLPPFAAQARRQPPGGSAAGRREPEHRVKRTAVVQAAGKPPTRPVRSWLLTQWQVTMIKKLHMQFVTSCGPVRVHVQLKQTDQVRGERNSLHLSRQNRSAPYLLRRHTYFNTGPFGS